MNSEVILMVIDVGSQIIVAVTSPLILGGLYKLMAVRKKDKLAHEELQKQISYLSGSLKSISRSQIVQMYELGKSNKGMTLNQKSTVEELYEDYKKLGGNGFIEGIMDKIRNMDELDD